MPPPQSTRIGVAGQLAALGCLTIFVLIFLSGAVGLSVGGQGFFIIGAGAAVAYWVHRQLKRRRAR